MGWPAVTEENLANQIAVVKEEIRVNVLNEPYGGFPWLTLGAGPLRDLGQRPRRLWLLRGPRARHPRGRPRLLRRSTTPRATPCSQSPVTSRRRTPWRACGTATSGDVPRRTVLTASGEFRAEVVPEEQEGSWRTLSGPDELVEYYDPTDVFGDLADAIAEAYPAVSPEAPAGEDGTGELPLEKPPRPTRRPRTLPRPRPARTPSPTTLMTTMPTTVTRRKATTRARRAARPRDDAARRGRARRQPRDPPRPMAPGLSRTRSRERVAGRAVRPRPDRRLLRSRPASTVLAQHRRCRDRHRDDPFPRHRPGHRVVHPPAAWRSRSTCSGPSDGRSRSTRAAGICCSSPAAWGWPGFGCLPTRRSARGARSRCCSEHRAPARCTRRACCPMRSSTSSPRTTDPRSSRVRDGPRAGVRGLGRPGVRMRAQRHASRARPTGRGPPRTAGCRTARAQARRGQDHRTRITCRAAQGVPPGLDGAEHGLRGRGVPRLRRHERQRDAPTRLPRGPGIRQRRAGVGGCLVVKAKRRVVTSTGRPAGARRAPTIRQVRSAIVPATPRVRTEAGAKVSTPAPIASPPPADVDLTVDLGRGLVLPNPILVASGTFGYGIEYGDVVDVDRLGAICCKGTTLKPRIGNVHATGDRDAGRDAQLDRPPEPGRRCGRREVRRDVGGLEGASHRERGRGVGRRLRRGDPPARGCAGHRRDRAQHLVPERRSRAACSSRSTPTPRARSRPRSAARPTCRSS